MVKNGKVTLTDIANIVGLSPRAVSAAIHGNGRVSERNRQRVLEVANQMGYRPNIMARGLAAQQTYLIGVVFPFVSGSFYARVLQGIEDQALKADYRVVICSAGWNPKVEAQHIADLVNRGVDGLIIVPRTDSEVPYDELKSLKIPTVQVFHAVPGLRSPSICLRNEEGAYKATMHLIQARRVCPFHLPGGKDSQEAQERLNGFRRAVEEAGFGFDPAQCVFDGLADNWELGRQAMRQLVAQRRVPQAIFAVNDYAALGAMRAAHEAGLQVPRDLSVVGYDDLELSGMQVTVGLTTIRQPKETVGELAVQMLLNLIEGRQVNSVELTPELVVRESSSCSF